MTVNTLAAPSLDAGALRRQLDALRVAYGTCQLIVTTAGDGKTNTPVRLECDRGPLDFWLHGDDDGKLRQASFLRPPGVACVP